MYTNTGFLDKEEADLTDRAHPLRINSCGNYKMISRSVMSTFRPEGREDYQLLYIAAGKAWFMFGEEEKEVQAGNMVLYRPNEPQSYCYYQKDKLEVYWIHFTGYDVETCLEKCGLGSGFIFPMGISSEYQELFLKIIRELQIKRASFGELCCLYFQQLLTLMHRRIQEGHGEDSRMPKEIEGAVIYFHENFPRDIKIEEYAKSQHMSTCWFIRSFKRYMGMPPLQYITSLRINRAKELLRDTDYSVTEIGSLVGYENPLYFSRIFRGTAGMSPREWRCPAEVPPAVVPPAVVPDTINKI